MTAWNLASHMICPKAIVDTQYTVDTKWSTLFRLLSWLWSKNHCCCVKSDLDFVTTSYPLSASHQQHWTRKLAVLMTLSLWRSILICRLSPFIALLNATRSYEETFGSLYCCCSAFSYRSANILDIHDTSVRILCSTLLISCTIVLGKLTMDWAEMAWKALTTLYISLLSTC